MEGCVEGEGDGLCFQGGSTFGSYLYKLRVTNTILVASAQF